MSQRVLIGRGLDHNSLIRFCICQGGISKSGLYSVLRVHENVTLTREEKRLCAERYKAQPVPMTTRIHLFPCRTQKLSSFVPKILGWRRPGKIGRCRLSLSLKWPVGQAVKTAASHAANGSSILPRVTKQNTTRGVSCGVPCF